MLNFVFGRPKGGYRQTDRKKYVKVEEEEKAEDNVRLFLSVCVCASIQVYVNVCTRSVKGEMEKVVVVLAELDRRENVQM